MSQRSAVTEAAILIALTFVIAAVLEAVFRICNLLNTPINATLLAAGTISAALLRTRHAPL